MSCTPMQLIATITSSVNSIISQLIAAGVSTNDSSFAQAQSQLNSFSSTINSWGTLITKYEGYRWVQ